jgi:hypothetical protein
MVWLIGLDGSRPHLRPAFLTSIRKKRSRTFGPDIKPHENERLMNPK